jgi:hypothetical protein
MDNNFGQKDRKTDWKVFQTSLLRGQTDKQANSRTNEQAEVVVSNLFNWSLFFNSFSSAGTPKWLLIVVKMNALRTSPITKK